MYAKTAKLAGIALWNSKQFPHSAVLNKYNDSDKNFGSVRYSRDLHRYATSTWNNLESIWLYDEKGTHEYTVKQKDLILNDVARRLKIKIC